MAIPRELRNKIEAYNVFVVSVDQYLKTIFMNSNTASHSGQAKGIDELVSESKFPVLLERVKNTYSEAARNEKAIIRLANAQGFDQLFMVDKNFSGPLLPSLLSFCSQMEFDTISYNFYDVFSDDTYDQNIMKECRSTKWRDFLLMLRNMSGNIELIGYGLQPIDLSTFDTDSIRDLYSRELIEKVIATPITGADGQSINISEMSFENFRILFATEFKKATALLFSCMLKGKESEIATNFNEIFSEINNIAIGNKFYEISRVGRRINFFGGQNGGNLSGDLEASPYFGMMIAAASGDDTRLVGNIIDWIFRKEYLNAPMWDPQNVGLYGSLVSAKLVVHKIVELVEPLLAKTVNNPVLLTDDDMENFTELGEIIGHLFQAVGHCVNGKSEAMMRLSTNEVMKYLNTQSGTDWTFQKVGALISKQIVDSQIMTKIRFRGYNGESEHATYFIGIMSKLGERLNGDFGINPISDPFRWNGFTLFINYLNNEVACGRIDSGLVNEIRRYYRYEEDNWEQYTDAVLYYLREYALKPQAFVDCLLRDLLPAFQSWFDLYRKLPGSQIPEDYNLDNATPESKRMIAANMFAKFGLIKPRP
jgi:hypothetical protein